MPKNSNSISVKSDGDHKSRIISNVYEFDKRKRHFMNYEVFACVNLYNVYPAILIVEFKDTICRRTSKISLYFKKIIQGWCLLCDKPIVWPVTHLVLKMNQMLTGPGKK